MRRVVNLFLIIVIIINVVIYITINNNKYKKYDTSNIEFKMIGDKYITINPYDDYKDLGVKVLDNNKEDIIYSNDSISHECGKYILQYKYKEYTLYRIIEVKDTIKPVIKLKGNNTINIFINDKYQELGYEVSDNSRDDLKDKVIVTNNINSKKKGTYKVIYEVTDLSGNYTKVERTVNVKDKKINIKTGYTSNISKKQVEKRKPTKENIIEKDISKKTDVSKSTYPNTMSSMKWYSKGIKIYGKLFKVGNQYDLKICNSDKCYSQYIKVDNKEYGSTINLSNLDNGDYTLLINYNDIDYPVYNELSQEERLVRSRINDKLVTIFYESNKVSIKIEDFKYIYDVLIDVGHGGSDTGASNKYILEKTLNLTQSLYEKKRYEEHGLKVLITRSDDTYGLMMGSSTLPNIRRRSLAVGYYGVVSKVVYSNHHNSTENKKMSGYELILTNQGSYNDYKIEYQIAREFSNIYPNLDTHIRVYGRNYDTDAILSKEKGQVYNIKNYYAMQRIPYNLYNIYTITYEGCYLSNIDDFNWYINNWKQLSEIKIKNYVEYLGIKYKEP